MPAAGPVLGVHLAGKLRRVRSDCCVVSYGVDDLGITWWGAPETFIREAIKALAAGQLLDFSTEPLRMPNIAVRLGLFVADSWVWNVGAWPCLQPFTDAELRNGYTDPYGNRFAGYANHGDYVNRVKDAVNGLISQGLYDPKIGQATVIDEVTNCPFPLPPRKYSAEQQACGGFWSGFTQKCYGTVEERANAEARLAAFFGRGSKMRRGWGGAR